MTKINVIQKQKIEKLLQMDSGYVSNFSNRTMQNFIAESVKIDIYDVKYSKFGDSKANRLRCFLNIESDYKIKKLMNDLINYQYEIEKTRIEFDSEKEIDEKLFEECRAIVALLGDDLSSDTLDSLENCEIDDESIELLLKSIRDNIENSEPELAVDRMHTFSVKFIRNLCDKYGILYDRTKPLHSCYGEYIKYLEQNSRVESDMTLKILKYSISIFDAFNYVRNNQSYAHDNDILNYNESLLVFRSISAVLLFISSIEEKYEKSKSKLII